MERERKEAVHFPGGDATASSVPTAERPRTRPPNLPPLDEILPDDLRVERTRAAIELMQSLAPPSVKTTGTGATRLDRDVKRWREEAGQVSDILLRREHDEREARAAAATRMRDPLSTTPQRPTDDRPVCSSTSHRSAKPRDVAWVRSYRPESVGQIFDEAAAAEARRETRRRESRPRGAPRSRPRSRQRRNLRRRRHRRRRRARRTPPGVCVASGARRRSKFDRRQVSRGATRRGRGDRGRGAAAQGVRATRVAMGRSTRTSCWRTSFARWTRANLLVFDPRRLNFSRRRARRSSRPSGTRRHPSRRRALARTHTLARIHSSAVRRPCPRRRRAANRTRARRRRLRGV